ncbi:Caveolae-associated protein 1 [Triplophysa tibetana]|uniref:Caveolae-associated protein 1 n=1 Tax=Triplophysa tibetana TaxID=1572043 RepID=A0A5A9NAP7_9TELE|nr:Caveolae-associated protein 1 [Triplophysa tibetana]
MANTEFKLERAVYAEVSDDDEEIALVTPASKPAKSTKVSTSKRGDDDDDSDSEVDLMLGPGLDGGRSEGVEMSEAQATGMMVLALLDKIIGVVDQIQETQTGLEAKQETMEKNMSGIQTDLAKLAKSHVGTAGTVNKLLDKVRKVNVNVKSVRKELDKQAGQIKKLENNEHELLKRKNFKVLIFQQLLNNAGSANCTNIEMRQGAVWMSHNTNEVAKYCLPVKLTTPKDKEKPVKEAKKPVAVGEEVEQVLSEGGEEVEEEVVIEEIIEESRSDRIKRSGLQKVDNLKKAFSKEQMEKTRQRTKDNLEKTRQRTKANLEKTRQRTRENLEKTKKSFGKKMGKLGTKMTPNTERREKIRSSREKTTKSLTPAHKFYGRHKFTTYRVPPFTFHVKKIREGEIEPTPEPEEQVEENEEVQEILEEEEGVGVVSKVEEGELVNLYSPETDALLEAADHARLVLQDTFSEQGARREETSVGTAHRASAINTDALKRDWCLSRLPSVLRVQLLVKTVFSFTSVLKSCQSNSSWKCAAHFRIERSRLRASGPRKVSKDVFRIAKNLLNSSYWRFGRLGNVSTALVSAGDLWTDRHIFSEPLSDTQEG